MNKDLKDIIVKGLEGKPEDIIKEVDRRLQGILDVLNLESVYQTYVDLVSEFPELTINIRSIDYEINVNIVLNNPKEDMKGPLRFLAKRGHILTHHCNKESLLSWSLQNKIYLFGILKNSKCKWVQEGTKEIPNMVLKCEK